MLSDRCLSVSPFYPVCNVGVLWPDGWTDHGETWHAGRSRKMYDAMDVRLHLCRRGNNYDCTLNIKERNGR